MISGQTSVCEHGDHRRVCGNRGLHGVPRVLTSGVRHDGHGCRDHYVHANRDRACRGAKSVHRDDEIHGGYRDRRG